MWWSLARWWFPCLCFWAAGCVAIGQLGQGVDPPPDTSRSSFCFPWLVGSWGASGDSPSSPGQKHLLLAWSCMHYTFSMNPLSISSPPPWLVSRYHRSGWTVRVCWIRGVPAWFVGCARFGGDPAESSFAIYRHRGRLSDLWCCCLWFLCLFSRHVDVLPTHRAFPMDGSLLSFPWLFWWLGKTGSGTCLHETKSHSWALLALTTIRVGGCFWTHLLQLWMSLEASEVCCCLSLWSDLEVWQAGCLQTPMTHSDLLHCQTRSVRPRKRS